MNHQSIKNIIFEFFCLSLILALLLPTSLTSVAMQIGIDQHPLSFLIGPALYSYGTNLIPNIDYFTQYGTGLGYIFHFFLNDSPIKSYEHVVMFTLTGTIFFAVTYYLCAKLILNSRIWAIFLTTTTLMMNYFGPAPMRGPSCWPIRYPFLALFCLTYFYYSRSTSSEKQSLLILVLGILAGVSMFWITEIGVYMILAGGFCLWINAHNYRSKLQRSIAYAVVSLSTFQLLCLFAFGPQTFTLTFIIALFKPAFLYGAGFGYWPANWLSSNEFIFNVLCPIILATTVIWSVSSDKRNPLLLIAILGLLQLSKYWNMSLIAVWFSNSYLPLLVLCFWLRTGINSIKSQSVAYLATFTLCIIAILYASAFRDARMDFEYGFRMYQYYPSYLMKLLGIQTKYKPPVLEFSKLNISDKDVLLIQQHSLPGEQVFVYSSRDWAYLLRAKRAPGFPFTPATETPLLEQGERWQPFLNANIIFYDTDTALWNGNHLFKDFVQEKIKSEYIEIANGDHIKVYKRKQTT